jgi:hypothetical protein
MYNQIIFLNYNDKQILTRNEELKNIGNGRRAFLLATGPSIKLENLKLLAGEDCFSLSNFFLHDDLQSVNPLFHFFAPYHPPLILQNYIEWLTLADQRLPRDTRIFLGHTTYALVKQHNLFPNRQVFYLYLSLSPNDRKKIDLTRPILAPQTSPLMILPVLIYMGYTRIYLLGCDHTSLRDYKKEITNFYDPKKDVRKNAADVNAWGDIIADHETSMNVFRQYNFYREMLQKAYHSEIINLSRDTWLYSFERDTLSNIIDSG